MPEADVVVFDTGPLSHFAKQGWLGILRYVVEPRTAVIPDVVVAELRDGLLAWPHLRLVLDSTWLQRRELASESEMEAFGAFCWT